MRGNQFGKMLSMVSFGESHGPAMGVVLDGVPSNLPFSLAELEVVLKKRSPGKKGCSSRKEDDVPEILSGIFEGKTLGTPICVIVHNVDQRSGDYESFRHLFRKGHADKTTVMKYKIRDHRGGGRSSGRETVSRVIAGYFASLILPKLKVTSTLLRLGDFMPGKSHMKWDDYLESLKRKGQTVSSDARIVIKNCPVALGEPAFDKLKADMAKALLSIGGCYSFSFAGGIEGGISNGKNIEILVSFKAPSTKGKMATKGRHDPSILPRALPVVEAMLKFVIADHYLRQKAYEN